GVAARNRRESLVPLSIESWCQLLIGNRLDKRCRTGRDASPRRATNWEGEPQIALITPDREGVDIGPLEASLSAETARSPTIANKVPAHGFPQPNHQLRLICVNLRNLWLVANPRNPWPGLSAWRINPLQRDAEVQREVRHQVIVRLVASGRRHRVV